jgi:hypothetical protein
MDSLNNFFDKANNKVQSFLPNLLGLTPQIQARNHSGRYFGPDNETGVSRTRMIEYRENPNPGQGQISPAIVVDPPEGEQRNLPGFTPISYYTREYETYKGKIRAVQFETEGVGAKSGYSLNLSGYKTGEKGQFYTSFRDFEYSRDSVSSGFLTNLQSGRKFNRKNWPGEIVPTDSSNLSSESDRESFVGRYDSSKPWLRGNHFSGGKGTPYENEDPVFFGFEIIIDAANSPLFNGEILKFMGEIGIAKSPKAKPIFGSRSEGTIGSAEVFNRKPILDSFCFESIKYFKFKNDVGPYVVSPTFLDELSSELRDLFKNSFDMFGSVVEKKHYVKKVEGLDFLVERNGPKTPSGFVKYREDLIKISFYEDITLSTGTLLNLYKLLAWSRQRGKHIIPDNLLKFDCEIIISEVRNMTRIRSAFDEKNQPQTTQPGDQVVGGGSDDRAFFGPGGDPGGASLYETIRFEPPQPTGEIEDLPESPISTSQNTSLPLQPTTQLSSGSELAPLDNLSSRDLRGIPTNNLNSTVLSGISLPGQHDKKEQPKASKNALQVLEDNLSRYRYKLYECQFHVPALPHPSSIDLGSSLNSYDNHSIDISFKHSEVVFERFDYKNFSELNLNNTDGFGSSNPLSKHGRYIPLNNAAEIPFEQENSESNEINVKTDASTVNPTIVSGSVKIPIKARDSWQYASPAGSGIIDKYDRGIDENPSSTTTYGNSGDVLGDAKKNQRREDFKAGLESAVSNFTFATKRVALNAGQQLLNDQFRLLNNTIDKVRNAYGLGRISAPTNVYANVNPTQIGLQNAIRNFGGDVASSLLNLIPNGFNGN